MKKHSAVGSFDNMYPSSSLEDNTLETELDRFLAEPPEPKTTNILLFWKSHMEIFPTLSQMAYQYLVIPATSEPSERVFSGGRKILSYQHSSLSTMHVEQLACLKDWSQKLELTPSRRKCDGVAQFQDTHSFPRPLTVPTPSTPNIDLFGRLLQYFNIIAFSSPRVVILTNIIFSSEEFRKALPAWPRALGTPPKNASEDIEVAIAL
ncbi:hypothetical protein O181_043251 [Austropuccinia psidii MF-1]|uniref:HAT C-terminal dimerisation domain-containing protein n=1 Tax=Austropuccinia psidii MF-1 TaxID=1389203 RepID=A0A9Q3DGA3_9BASI|nr:hypothetical protein [Austropuccinia psidii MF-1]